jgi:hypothetical protein
MDSDTSQNIEDDLTAFFNRNPKKVCTAFELPHHLLLQQTQLPSSPSATPSSPDEAVQDAIRSGTLADDPSVIAKFLKNEKGLSVVAIGDFLGERDDLVLRLLPLYVGLFNFAGLGLDDALRSPPPPFTHPSDASSTHSASPVRRKKSTG